MSHVRCGQLCWTLTETDAHSPGQNRTYRFDFSYIRSETLQRELQDYFWSSYKSGDKMLSTLRQEQSWFHYYEEWLYRCGVDSLAQIRPTEAEGFLTYLHVCVSKKTGQPLRMITQKHIYDTVRGIYRWYALRREEYRDAFLMFPVDVYQRINRTVRTQSATKEQTVIFARQLEQTTNPCLRYGGTILLTTGIAPGDLLGLRADCLQVEKGAASLRFYHHRKRMYRTIPVNHTCADAVQRLREETEKLREIAPEECREQLFLYCDRQKKVITPTPDLFRHWMRQMQVSGAENDEASDEVWSQSPDSITDRAPDELLTCTMLRYGLVRDMRAHHVPAMIVQELTGCSLFAERRLVV